MAVVVRKLKQKRHWDNVPWLPHNDTQADVMQCSTTKTNTLSVYVLEEPDWQVERVIAALALTRDNIAHMDVAVVPDRVLTQCDIGKRVLQGDTPDSEVNSWHQDLVGLTIGKVARLAVAIKTQGKIDRYPVSKVKEAIKRSMSANCIGKERVRERMTESLRKHRII